MIPSNPMVDETELARRGHDTARWLGLERQATAPTRPSVPFGAPLLAALRTLGSGVRRSTRIPRIAVSRLRASRANELLP